LLLRAAVSPNASNLNKYGVAHHGNQVVLCDDAKYSTKASGRRAKVCDLIPDRREPGWCLSIIMFYTLVREDRVFGIILIVYDFH